jgi:hypothetical protein
MKEDLAYQKGRYDQITDIQLVLIEATKNYGGNTVSSIVKIHNDLVQYLHMEGQRWMDERLSTLASVVGE